MSQIQIHIIAVLVVAVYLENIFTLGNPLLLKKPYVDRHNDHSVGSAHCKKVCPETSELDWLFDWLFDDDEDCIYLCDITIISDSKLDSYESISSETHSTSKPRHKVTAKPLPGDKQKKKNTFDVSSQAIPP